MRTAKETYWIEFTLKMAVQGRTKSKKAARESLVNDYGYTIEAAKELVRSW